MAVFSDFSLLISEYNATLPTLADTQPNELQVDDRGRLIISGRWFEDAPHTSGDAGIFALTVRDDGVSATGTITIVDYTQLTGDTVTVNGTVLTEGVDWTAGVSNDATATSLAAAINALAAISASATLAVITIVADPGASGNSVTLAGSDVINLTLSGATLTGGADNTTFTSDNYDYSPIAVDKYGRIRVIADLDVDFDYVYAEDSVFANGSLGAYVLAVRQDTLATDTSATGDFASFKVNALGELYVTDTSAISQLTTANTNLSNIDTSLNNIETEIQALSHLEDAAHSSGDAGILALAVRNDNAATVLTSANGDYSGIAVDQYGKVFITGSVSVSPVGNEQYTVTDALAANGDGLITITAAATPWITVASLAHTSGTAYVVGAQWTCDQNAQARLITDDTVDIVVYKNWLNSSAQPGIEEHFADSGRIEIAGAANMEIKLQIKKRSATSGNAQGSGSIHIRTA